MDIHPAAMQVASQRQLGAPLSAMKVNSDARASMWGFLVAGAVLSYIGLSLAIKGHGVGRVIGIGGSLIAIPIFIGAVWGVIEQVRGGKQALYVFEHGVVAQKSRSGFLAFPRGTTQVEHTQVKVSPRQGVPGRIDHTFVPTAGTDTFRITTRTPHELTDAQQMLAALQA